MEVERIDEADPQLPTDDEAIQLARAAGVDCRADGTLTPYEAAQFSRESLAVFGRRGPQTP